MIRCGFGGDWVSDVFFEQRGGALRRLEMSGVEVLHWDWQFPELITVGSGPQGDGPVVTGLVFHMGRSGSTWLARLLAVDPGTLVLNEPDAINEIVRMHLNGSGRAPDLAAAVAELTAVIVRRTHPNVRRVILKTTGWNALAASCLMDAFPDANAVFLTRSSAEVVESLQRTPPAWARVENGWLHGAAGENVTGTDYLWVISKILGGVTEAIRQWPDRVCLVDYWDLPGDLDQVANWLGLKDSPTPQQVAEVSGTHSKTGRPWQRDSSGTRSSDLKVERDTYQIDRRIDELRHVRPCVEMAADL